MRSRLREDVRAVRANDPAARSTLEILLCYPGLHALWGHRVSHWLWRRRLRLAARLLSQAIRWATGVEIHPGATIGRRVVIGAAIRPSRRGARGVLAVFLLCGVEVNLVGETAHQSAAQSRDLGRIE